MANRADCIRAAVAAGATEEQAADIVDAIMEEKKPDSRPMSPSSRSRKLPCADIL